MAMNGTPKSRRDERPPQQARSFEAIAGAAVATQILLGVCVVAAVVHAVAHSRSASLINRVLEGERVSEALMQGARNSDHFIEVTENLGSLALLVTGVMWLMWFRRVYANLPSLGASELRFTSGWAVGAWFVPFLNFVRPKAMADDMWRASDPDAPAMQRSDWRSAAVPKLLHVWWALWVGWFLSEMLVPQFDERELELEELRLLDQLWVLSAAVLAAAAIAALFVVRAISNRQAQRAVVLGLIPVVAARNDGA